MSLNASKIILPQRWLQELSVSHCRLNWLFEIFISCSWSVNIKRQYTMWPTYTVLLVVAIFISRCQFFVVSIVNCHGSSCVRLCHLDRQHSFISGKYPLVPDLWLRSHLWPCDDLRWSSTFQGSLTVRGIMVYHCYPAVGFSVPFAVPWPVLLFDNLSIAVWEES